MIHFEDEYFVFRASDVSATFSDGQTMQLDSISSQPFTPIGYEWIFSVSESSAREKVKADEHQKQQTPSETNHPYVVRLYVITPEKDWRARNNNASYSWKLDSGWMSDEAYDWIHWNVEGFINSEIQVMDNQTLFQCDEMAFHFDTIGKLKTSYSVALEKLVMANVKMGARLVSTNKDIITSMDNYTALVLDGYKVYRPCSMSSTYCAVVDGLVVGGRKSTSVNSSTAATTTLKVMGTIGVLVVFLFSIGCWMLRAQRAALYQRLEPNPGEDLTLEVHESCNDDNQQQKISYQVDHDNDAQMA
jgi:hypothetical protein